MGSDSKLQGLRDVIAEFRAQIERLRGENRALRQDVVRLTQASQNAPKDALVTAMEEEIRVLRLQNKNLRAQLRTYIPVMDVATSQEMIPTLKDMTSDTFSPEESPQPEPSRSRWKIHLSPDEI